MSHEQTEHQHDSIPEEHPYANGSLQDYSPCFLCKSPVSTAAGNLGRGVRQLRQQINTAQHLASLSRNSRSNTPNKEDPTDDVGSWKAKVEILENEMKKLQQDNEAYQSELEMLKEKMDERYTLLVSLENQQQRELSAQDAKYQQATRKLDKMRSDLSKDNSIGAQLNETMLQLERKKGENQDLSLQLRERSLEVEVLERRLLEEEDANRVWTYKYVGSL